MAAARRNTRDGVLLVLLVLMACGKPVQLGSYAGRGHASRVAVGLDHMCVLNGGQLYCHGYSVHGNLIGPTPLALVEGVSDAAQVSAGRSFTCVLRRTAEVACVGTNERGELGDGTTETRFDLRTIDGLSAVRVEAGGGTACAIDPDGELWCWGDNEFGEADPASPGENVLSPRIVPLPVAVRDVSPGDEHTCATGIDDRVFCFGRNDAGQLGDGTTMARLAPVESVDLADVLYARVSTNPFLDDHTCALMSGGNVRCWGDDTTGSIGDGFEMGNPVSRPRDTSLLTDVTTLVSGGKTLLARQGNQWFFWGNPGAMGVVIAGEPGDQHEPIAIDALEDFDEVDVDLAVACGLRDERFFCWGRNDLSQFAGFPEGPVPMMEFVLPR